MERAIACACKNVGSELWANQVPVSSGLVRTAPDRRRAIDLVHQRHDGHFEFIELKLESDTPLFAAIEIIEYGCLWVIARSDKPSRTSALLDADRIDLRVLAPAAYYSSFALDHVEASLDCGVRALGDREGVKMSFAFKRLHDLIIPAAMPDDKTLMDCLAQSLA